MSLTEWDYSDITPEVNVLAKKMEKNSQIDVNLYSKYDVKRGLRDLDGKGVLTGLTDISTIKQNKLVDGKLVPCDGELYYRGYNVNDIVSGIHRDNRFGFEEIVYLLLFGELPDVAELQSFKDPAAKLCAPRDPQGAERRYDELYRAQCADAVLLRQKRQRYLDQQCAQTVRTVDFGVPAAVGLRLPRL